MKKIYTIVCVLSLGFSLSSCSYFDTEEEPIVYDTGEPVQIQQERAGLPEDYAQSVSKRTGGSVQVFSFGDDESMNASQAMPSEGDIVVSTNQDVNSAPASSAPMQQVSPSVEVFSFGRNAQRPQAAYAPTQMNASSDQGFVTLTSGQNASTVIYFNHDSARLSPSDLAKIDEVAKMYNSGFAPMIEVEGHASSVTSEHDIEQQRVVNLKVSMDRAFAVSRALIERGVPASKIKTKGYGDTRPVRTDSSPQAHEANRRVEVFGR